jgi:hypothetical protein
MWKVITDNPLVSAVVAGLILAGLAWTIKKLKDRSDSQRIYKFISDSDQTFRTTHAISSETHIPESRVAELCSQDKRIKRNELEKQSWRIAPEK